VLPFPRAKTCTGTAPGRYLVLSDEACGEGLTAVELCTRLREAEVAVRPGSEFGMRGEHYLQLSNAERAPVL
jgi:aspartate/methionine/tyrosine aminotransferase